MWLMDCSKPLLLSHIRSSKWMLSLRRSLFRSYISQNPREHESAPRRRNLVVLSCPHFSVLCNPSSGGRSERTASSNNLKVGSTSIIGDITAVTHDMGQKMIWMPILQSGVFRFDSSEDGRREAFPSLSFAHPERREKSLGECKEPTYVAHWNLENNIQSVIIELPSGTSFYGTGEVSGSLERTGRRIFTWNSDAWGFGKRTACLYQAHPWVFAVLPDGKAFGVLADTPRRCEVDLRKESTIKFIAESFYPIITFGPYSSPEDLLITLSDAIGTISMPPKWALGYQQCRWSYEPASKVEEVARLFRENKIPCDVVWMDIDYMDGFRCFTFDPEKFPDPVGLATTLNKMGFKAVWMIDPGIKQDKGYSVYDDGCQEDNWVVDANGKEYLGDVWPGPCVFADFTQAKVRTWWSKLIKDFVHNGVDGIWNDMNEPTVFKSVSKTMPDDNIHKGDEELGGQQNHLYYHNVYGMLMARATYEGMKLGNPNKRPFVLTRAGFLGSQRYAATWTGDNLSNWDHAHMSISMVLNLSLSGQPFSGPDIGGFAGDATARLFGRWMGFGSLFPFARGHSEKGTVDHEPWSFGKECANVCRLALRRRYQLLPHLYTLFYNAHTKGLPVITPTFFADSRDPRLRTVENSFLLGPLFVCCSTDPEKIVDPETTVIPNGTWQRFDFDDYHPDLPLLYLKGGSIIPVGPPIEYVGESKFEDPVTLIVALDQDGKADGVLYEDSGDGFDFQNGHFLITHYEAKRLSTNRNDGSEVLVKVASTEGCLKRPNRSLHVRLLIGDRAELKAEGRDGEDLILKFPSASEMLHLVETAIKQANEKTAHVKGLAEYDIKHDELKGVGAPKVPVELSGTDFQLKVVPWIGGRIISMVHKGTGIDLFQGRLESGGYEEYGSAEYRGAGCTEEYDVIRRSILELNGEDVLNMEGDIGGGLSMCREIAFRKDTPKAAHITSAIVAKAVGAGAGGFSRIVCLRIHPTFQVPHPKETFVKFTAIDGSNQEYGANFGETFLRGDNRPNGEWMLVDKAAAIAVVNRFNIEEVSVCLIHWGAALCNLELWSEERSVSKDSPIRISHEYEIKDI